MAKPRVTLPAVPAVLLAIISVQAGAALAKRLFPVLGAATTTSLRIGLAAVVLLAIVRPPLRRLSAAQWRAALPYGLALGLMNGLFYAALARVPLGLAVTVEFIGPLGLALVGARRWVEVIWVGLAGLGISLLTPWTGQGVDLVGLSLALAAGGCWAAYIVLGQRTAVVLPGQQGVALGMLVALVPVLPFGLASGGWQALTPALLLLGALLALFSSVLPFSLELHALRTMPTRTFSILLSLEPVAAALAGRLLLHEHLSEKQWLAIGCIVVASSGATLTARRPMAPVASE